MIGLAVSSSTFLITNVKTVHPTWTAALSDFAKNGLLRWTNVPNLESLSKILNCLS